MPHLNILNNEEKKDILKILCMGTSILMLFKMILDHKHMAQFSILALQKSYFFLIEKFSFFVQGCTVVNALQSAICISLWQKLHLASQP